MTPVQSELFALQDTKYRDFQAKLIPNVDPARIKVSCIFSWS